jgi:thiamine-phosphate pyrophosphorylase
VRSKAALLDFDLYPVTAEKLSRRRNNLEVLEALLGGGASIVQLREKEIDDRSFYELALAFRRRTRQAHATLILNDRVDICMAVDADGVHLGQDDLPIPVARRLVGQQRIIGVSTHNLDEALRAAAQGADYINVGPIYPTVTKEHVGPAVGIELFRQVSRCVQLPITVMGGIKLDNLDPLLEAGARRIAVVTAVVSADDISEAVRQLRAKIAEYHRRPMNSAG